VPFVRFQSIDPTHHHQTPKKSASRTSLPLPGLRRLKSRKRTISALFVRLSVIRYGGKAPSSPEAIPAASHRRRDCVY